MSGTDRVDTDKVSMTKQGAEPATGRPGRPGRPVRPQPQDIPKIPTPRTIDFAAYALGLMAVALWLRWLGLLGHESSLEAWANKVNRDAKTPVKNFDAQNYVHSIRLSAAIIAVVLSLAVALLIGVMRRPRNASSSRWGLLIVLVLTQVPLWVYPQSGWPALATVSAMVAGAASIAALVSVFLPPSAAYFRACREAMVPPELRGQPRPGLGSLLRARPPRGAPAASGPVRGGGATAPAARPSASRAKAKVRSDAEAVAKGAELARTRAKSSKSRRPE